MQFLLLAILASTAVSVCMRLSTDKIKNNYGMLTMSYISSMVVAALHVGADSGFISLLPFGRDMTIVLGFGAFSGLVYLLGFVLLQSNMKSSGIVLSSVFMKLGLLVPMLISVLFLGESMALLQVLGFALAITAIVLINYKKGAGGSFSLSLILLLLSCGMADTMSKLFEQFGPAELSAQFLFYIFLWACILCSNLMFFKNQRIGKAELLYGLVVGVPNYYSSRFLLKSLDSVPAVIAYPSFSVGTMLLVTLIGVVFFHERLRRLQWIAVAIILVALALLNM